jgi:hypothetical protein
MFVTVSFKQTSLRYIKTSWQKSNPRSSVPEVEAVTALPRRQGDGPTICTWDRDLLNF